MDLSNVDDVVDQAVDLLVSNMANPKNWPAIGKVFGGFLGRGRSKPAREEEKLNEARNEALSSEDAKNRVSDRLRSQIETTIDFRPGALEELRGIVATVLKEGGGQADLHASAEAADGSVAQAAARDLIIGEQHNKTSVRRRSKFLPF